MPQASKYAENAESQATEIDAAGQQNNSFRIFGVFRRPPLVVAPAPSRLRQLDARQIANGVPAIDAAV